MEDYCRCEHLESWHHRRARDNRNACIALGCGCLFFRPLPDEQTIPLTGASPSA